MLEALLDVLKGIVVYRDYWLTVASFGVVGFVIRLLRRR
jgi:hypothetical protein